MCPSLPPSPPTPPDSAPATSAHIARVRELILAATANLIARGITHDASKLRPPEKEAFDRAAPLWGIDPHGPEYEAAKASLGDALTHHYAHNSHHPEHYPDGIVGMSLFDLLEMTIDWWAASGRHATGSVARSIEEGAKRFGISPDVKRILENTYRELGALPAEAAGTHRVTSMRS